GGDGLFWNNGPQRSNTESCRVATSRPQSKCDNAHTMTFLRGVLAAALMAAPLAAYQTTPPTYQERDFLSRIRRLTVEGRRAGEGYWSPDGKRIVFQSEREPGNPIYQIYVLDLGTGETKRISPGFGKTTCAFFRPGTDEIEF